MKESQSVSSQTVIVILRRHDRVRAVGIVSKGIDHGDGVSFRIHVEAGLAAAFQVHVHQHPHVIGSIPGGRLVVLGQPPLAADEGVEAIVRHVSILKYAIFQT